MDFTYNTYLRLIEQLKLSGYEIANYHNWQSKNRCVILRHDIDYDVSKALRMAEIEGVAVRKFGEHTVIGMGSIVTKSIPGNVIAFGIPAKSLKENNSDL